MGMTASGSAGSRAVIGGYKLVRELGRGGMGVVYLAAHPRLKCEVALKILPQAAVGDPSAVARFVREAQLAAQISDPNVVKIRDVDHEGTDHFIVMDYVQGSTLHDLVKEKGGPLPWRDAVRLVLQAARGAAAVHARGLIHRDIKPANVMVARKQVLLMDFGLAREVDESDVTGSRVLLGTPAYMSPEQSRSERLDPRSDVFSLGGTLYYLLTGRTPYDGNEALLKLATNVPPRPVHDLNAFVPRAVSDCLARVMAPRKDDRPRDADALVAELARLLKECSAPSAVADDTEDRSKLKTGPQPVELSLVLLEPIDDARRVSRQWRWAVAGVAACGVVVAIALATRGRTPAGGAPPGEKDAPAKVDRPGMVHIPAGQVQIGNTEDELRNHLMGLDRFKDKPELVPSFLNSTIHPPRQAVVPAFWIDETEVTRAEYARFLRVTRHPPPDDWEGTTPRTGEEQYPVTRVTHADALAYATWAGKKLPTEEQWVRAFRDDKNWMYPWGNQWGNSRANVFEHPTLTTITAVSRTPDDVTRFGVRNMVGNVSEWLRDERIREEKRVVVTCGASWKELGQAYGVAAYVPFGYPPSTMKDTIGFRCVVEGP